MNSATMDHGHRYIEMVVGGLDPSHIISIDGSAAEHDGTEQLIMEDGHSYINHDDEQLVIDEHNQLIIAGNRLVVHGGGMHNNDLSFQNHIMPDGIINEMVVEQNVEVGSEEQSDDISGEIILVPNSYMKQELMEASEVVVDANMHTQSVGNEIVIDERDHHTSNMGLSDIDASDDEFDESALVIDTSTLKDEVYSNSIAYDCGECGAVLKSRTSLQKHIKKYHSANDSEPEEIINKTFSCPACSYQTTRRDKLDKHMAKHIVEGYSITGKKRTKSTPPLRMRHTPEEYKCPLCPYKCTIEKAYRKHQKLHGGALKQYVIKASCKICGKDRPSEADMRKHMKKHRDGKDFLCDVCGFASIQLKKIIQHRRMHTGEKPHLCPHCSYRSARRDNLRSHVRRMHKKENMYIDTFNPKNEAALSALADMMLKNVTDERYDDDDDM